MAFALLSSDLPFDRIVFLVDDQIGTWFDIISEKLLKEEAVTSSDKVIRLDKKEVDDLNIKISGDGCVNIFKDIINKRLSTNETLHFCVVTDSDFQQKPDGGVTLLHELKNLNGFERGVVYSLAVSGNDSLWERDIIEKLPQSNDDARRKEEGEVIARFFKEGIFRPLRPFKEMVDRMIFLEIMKSYLPDEDSEYHQRNLFAKCRAYGFPIDPHVYPDAWCNPILYGFGSEVDTPFSGDSMRFFKEGVFGGLLKCFDKRVVPDDKSMNLSYFQVPKTRRNPKQVFDQ